MEIQILVGSLHVMAECREWGLALHWITESKLRYYFLHWPGKARPPTAALAGRFVTLKGQ